MQAPLGASSSVARNNAAARVRTGRSKQAACPPRHDGSVGGRGGVIGLHLVDGLHDHAAVGLALVLEVLHDAPQDVRAAHLWAGEARTRSRVNNGEAWAPAHLPLE